MKKSPRNIRMFPLFLSLVAGSPGIGQYSGIGTASPQSLLHLRSPGVGQLLRVEGVNPYISFFNGSAYRGYLWYNSNRMELGTPLGSLEPVVIAPGRLATVGVSTNGRMGIGNLTPGERLDVNGNINLRGVLSVNANSGTNGQVLTSNGAGDPQWQDASFGNTTRFCFNMNENGGGGTVNFFQTKYNLDPAEVIRNPASITINRPGLYQFDLHLNIIVTYAAGPSAEPAVYLEFSVNGDLYHVMQGKEIPLVYSSSGFKYGLTHQFRIQLYITAPTTITLPYDIYTIGSPDARQIFGHFTGNLISD